MPSSPCIYQVSGNVTTTSWSKETQLFTKKKYVKIEMVFGYGLRQVGQKILIASHLKFMQIYFEKNHLYLEYYILPVYHVFL